MTQVFTLVVPQWQGGGVGTGPFHGARSMLKKWGENFVQAQVYVHEQSVTKKEENIWYEYEIIDHVQQILTILDEHRPERIVTLGGDCGSDFVLISYLNKVHDGNLTVLWLSAHADIHTPESSPSHRFHGMPVRLLLGEGAPGLLRLLPSQLDVEQFVYSGLRDVGHAERQYIVDNQIPIVPVCCECGDMLNMVVEKTGRKNLYIHLNLDVIDPVDFDSVAYPFEGGFRYKDLLESFYQLGDQFSVVGCAVTGYHPQGSEENAAKVREILTVIKEIMG